MGLMCTMKAVVIEDVITTGGSTMDVIEVLRQAGATVAAAGSIVDRRHLKQLSVCQRRTPPMVHTSLD